MVAISVKWGKELFKDVEVDLDQPPAVLKAQLYALSNVPPDRQKIMVKGGLLGDDSWGKASSLKPGQTLMMMGTADEHRLQEPTTTIQFLEDLPEDTQDNLEMMHYGAGLQNLGNTCYMNSTLQCLYSVPELQAALSSRTPAASSAGTGTGTGTDLAGVTSELFKSMSTSAAAVAPYRFLMALRQQYPQFNQTGRGGQRMQQDAEECWTNLMFTLRQALKTGEGAPQSEVDRLFGIGMHTKLTCEESGEVLQEDATATVLKCNITIDISHLHEGIQLGLKEDREKISEALGHSAVFKGGSELTRLPPYLTLQMMRFFYKVDTQQKAKIMRKVSFQLVLDLYEFCSDELKGSLEAARAAHKAAGDLEVARSKAGAGAAPLTAPAGDSAPEEEGMQVDGPQSDPYSRSGEATGRFELQAVLTHKGRSADSGHYVAWVRQGDGSWVLFDDEDMIPKKDEDILALSGGGDWHMCYMKIYRAQRVPERPEGKAVGGEGGAQALGTTAMES